MSAITFLIAVGIDIAKAGFDAARLGAEGKHRHKKFDNTPEGFARFAGWPAGFGRDRRTSAWRPPGPTACRWPTSSWRGASTPASSTRRGSPRNA